MAFPLLPVVLTPAIAGGALAIYEALKNRLPSSEQLRGGGASSAGVLVQAAPQYGLGVPVGGSAAQPAAGTLAGAATASPLAGLRSALASPEPPADTYVAPTVTDETTRRALENLLASSARRFRYGEVQRFLPAGGGLGTASIGGEPLTGVRWFARQVGMEDLLRYDPESGKVFWGQFEVPYVVMVGGRTYAPESKLAAIYEKLKKTKAKGR